MEEVRTAFNMITALWRVVKAFWDRPMENDAAWEALIEFGSEQIEEFKDAPKKCRHLLMEMWDAYLRFKKWEVECND